MILNYTIRKLINEERKLGNCQLKVWFYKYPKDPIIVWFGSPNNLLEDPYSRWKNIKGEWVCRIIHCKIPKIFYTPELDKYHIDIDNYAVPEWLLNTIMSGKLIDHYRSVGLDYDMIGMIQDNLERFEGMNEFYYDEG